MKRNLILRLLLSAILVFGLITVAGCGTQEKPSSTSENASTAGQKAASSASAPDIYKHSQITSGDQAKQLLVEGNARFVSGQALVDDISAVKREDLVKNGQHPFATILSCSDSRVPPELLFDQGLGDIFIVRTAGEVLDPVAEGSVEYGLEHLKTPLLVVMGHSKCGAVKATVETVESNGKMEGNIGEILKKVKPAVEQAKKAGATGDELFTKAEDDNIELVMAGLMQNPIVKELVEQKKLTIVGAKYHVDSGEVTWVEPKAEGGEKKE